ncbi:MAG: hypothetical protein MUC60_01295 [Oscillatoria sp. Prado101]|jgi:hypothetical protein|nr:hypothetical protein [Oscillatoria sp. Prado101]
MSVRLRKVGILFFPSLLGAVFLSAIVSAGAVDVVRGMLPEEEPVEVSKANAPPVQGYWKLDINVRRLTNPAVGGPANYEIMTYFNQIGSQLAGQFVETSGNACKDTSISGTVEAGKVNWTVLYTGSCCRGARMTFQGVRRSPNIVEGKLSPVGNTPPNCTLWWADVVMTKQN